MSHRVARVSSHVSPAAAATTSTDPVVVGYARTPLGTFGLQAQELGAHAIRAALKNAGLRPEVVEEVLLGQVLTAGCGQAPHRQAALLAGIPNTTPCTGINKVCASGMKALMVAAAMIRSGERKVVVVGGMESMSNAPYASLKARWGLRHGHGEMTDLMVHDGLTDAYDAIHMGECAERTAEKFSLSREALDDYAARSIRLAREAQEGIFKREIAPIEVKGRKGKVAVVDRDEQTGKVSVDGLSKLRPAFRPSGGVVTAGNSSPLSDGASAIVLMSRQEAMRRGIPILASVASMADAATTPQEFTIAPATAAKLAINKLPPPARSEIGVWEFNEAFAAVVLANNKLLEGAVDGNDVNVNGGAIALGHPLGCSVKLLMSKKGINNRTATEVGKKVVTIIRGKELTEFLLNNGTLLKKRCPEALKKCLDGKAPETEADNAKLVIPLITNGFMFRCVDATIQATDKPSGSTERRRRKWPDRVGRVAPQHQGYDPKGLYIVEWEGSKTMQYVLLAVVITAVLLMCLFPVWPMWAKLAVWYLTVAFSTFMTVLLVIRMICYVALWAFGADFWIFPNLLDEDLGVIESFQPLYSFAYRSDDWLMIVCRVLSVGVIAIAIHQLSQTHSLSDIGEFAKVQFLDIVEWGENKLQNGPEMKQRFPSLEQVKQETEIDGDNDTARVNTDYTTQDTGDYEDDLDETFEEETLHHRRQDSGDSSREDGWSSPSVAGSSSQGTGTVTTILPPPRPRSEPAVKEVAALGGLFGGYSSSSESEDDSVEEMQDEQDESSVEGVTGTRLESGGKPAQSKVAPIESTKDTPHHPVGGRMGRLRSMIAELVRPTIEATGGGIREKALAAAPWPVRQQVARLQNLCGDDKSSAQWRQLDCRLEDCLEESKLTITRLAEATADGVAVYLHSQPKIPDLEGRSTESSVVSSESVVDELMSQVSGPPESSPEEVLGDGPTGAVVFSRPPEIDEAVLKQVTESRVAEVVDPEEIERELEALAATHEKEVARRKWEDDFPIDGFKLASGELEERTSKWACKPNEGMDEMDRRRCTTGAEKKLGWVIL